MNSRSATISRCIGVSVAVFLSVSPGTQAGAACFTSADNRRLNFELIQQAPPPLVNGETDYSFYPLTGAATMQESSIAASRAAGVEQYYFQWANRSTVGVANRAGRIMPRKPNIQPRLGALKRTQRSDFSSIDAANACTLAQTSVAVGLPLQQAERFARPAAIRLARVSETVDQGVTGAPDTCLLLSEPLPAHATGVVLDYEVADGRTPEQTTAFLTAFTNLVHRAGKKAVLLVDPLDAPSQRYTGIDASNANLISHLFDRITVFLWSKNRQHDIQASYDSQLEMLRHGGPVDPKRLLIDFELADTTMADAKRVRGFIVQDRLAGAILWRHRAKEGGACDDPVNRKMACLLFASCS